MVDKIVIVIPTYGRNTLLERTLDSLSICDFPDSYVKTIVIENGPKVNAETICAKFSILNCDYLYTPVANKSSALNIALETIDDNTFIIFLDDDVRICREMISSYRASFENFGKDFFYGGPMGIDYEVAPSQYYQDFLPISAKGWKLSEHQVLKVTNLMGCNWAVHKSKIALVGGFDERFGPNSTTGATGQEHDMMLRLDNAGIKPSYVADALVWHYVPKERSTFRWALMRKYKGGLSEGIRNNDKYDLYTLKRSIKTEIISLIKALYPFSLSSIVFHLMKLQYCRGLIKGVKKTK